MSTRIIKSGGAAIGETVYFEACNVPDEAICQWSVEYGNIALNSTTGESITATIVDDAAWSVSVECCQPGG